MSHFDDLRRYYQEQPNEVSLETLAQCNAACTFCPYPTLERIGTRMPYELIRRLIDEMATWEHPFFFSPFKVNEPLLDKRLIPICQEFNEKVPKGVLRIFTNGSPLTEERAQEIAGLNRVVHLWVSLNSHDPEEYRRLMGLDFDRTARNLDRLHASDFPHPVVLSCVGFPNEEFRRYCFERWPKFQSTAIGKSAWIDYTDPQISEVPDSECSRWWELSITATGKVSLCCMDGEARYPLGDVNTQTMLEIYNSPGYRALRSLKSRRQSAEPCNRCSY